VIDRGGLGQLPDVLQQHGMVEIEFRAPRPGDKHRGSAQVAACRGDPAEFLADGGVAHQQVAEGLAEMMPSRHPAGLVEQPDSRAVIQPGALGPRQRPQGQGKRLRLACPPGLGHEGFGRRPEFVRVGRDVIVRLPRTYQKVA
jgi:hypothetical protein